MNTVYNNILKIFINSHTEACLAAFLGDDLKFSDAIFPKLSDWEIKEQIVNLILSDRLFTNPDAGLVRTGEKLSDTAFADHLMGHGKGHELLAMRDQLPTDLEMFAEGLDKVQLSNFAEQVHLNTMGCYPGELPNKFSSNPIKTPRFLVWKFTSADMPATDIVKNFMAMISEHRGAEFTFTQADKNVGGAIVFDEKGQVILDVLHTDYTNIPMDLAIARGLTVEDVDYYLDEPLKRWSMHPMNAEYAILGIEAIHETIACIKSVVTQPVLFKIDDRIKIAMLLALMLDDRKKTSGGHRQDNNHEIALFQVHLGEKYPMLHRDRQFLLDFIAQTDIPLIKSADLIIKTRDIDLDNPLSDRSDSIKTYF